MKTLISISFLTGLLVAACTNQHTKEGPPDPSAQLWLKPQDGTTNWTEAPYVLAGSGLVTLTQGEAMVAALQLRTYPELETVKGKAEIVFVGEANDVIGKIVFQPAKPLQERWYALSLDAVPEGLELRSALRPLSDGSHGVTFRVGSSPTVQAVVVCARSQGEHQVRIAPSEPVMPRSGWDGGLLARLSQNGKALECASANQFETAEPAAVFNCENLDERAELRVEVSAGDLVSMTGKPLNQGQAIDLRFVPAEQPLIGDSCRTYTLK